MYVNKKFMLLVALANLQKPINWAQVVFNNLHYRLWDLFATIKPKKRPRREMEFGGAQVINIILQHWFPVDPTFQLSKFENKDEKKDNFSIEFHPCHNPRFGLTTKAKGLQGCESRESPGVTSHAPRSVRKCEGVNPHTPKATPTLGDGILMDSRNFKEQFQGLKLNGLWRSLYH
jgi:hypothetical protein